MQLAIRPLTAERWPDLEVLFNAKGCSVARHCWCVYYRGSGPGGHLPPGKTIAQARRAELHALVAAGKAPGLIGYRDERPVGWVSLGPREDFARLRRSPIMKSVDDRPVWSVICFVVPPQYRGQGVARSLLSGAIDYARANHAEILEAYPVDRRVRSSDDAMWFGPKSMFDAAGFEEVARRKPDRPVVRKRL
jgi:GNAT superfamily N-acetyltransferase